MKNYIHKKFETQHVGQSYIHKTIKGLKETTHGYKKERNKANDFTCKLQYDVSIFSNRRQSDFTKCSLMISQREIMISRLV